MQVEMERGLCAFERVSLSDRRAATHSPSVTSRRRRI